MSMYIMHSVASSSMNVVRSAPSHTPPSHHPNTSLRFPPSLPLSLSISIHALRAVVEKREHSLASRNAMQHTRFSLVAPREKHAATPHKPTINQCFGVLNS